MITRLHGVKPRAHQPPPSIAALTPIEGKAGEDAVIGADGDNTQMHMASVKSVKNARDNNTKFVKSVKNAN